MCIPLSLSIYIYIHTYVYRVRDIIHIQYHIVLPKRNPPRGGRATAGRSSRNNGKDFINMNIMDIMDIIISMIMIMISSSSSSSSSSRNTSTSSSSSSIISIN